jgi:non-ribosomal peptide synthetase component F
MVHHVEIDREPGITNFWMRWKESATPCYFPSLIDSNAARSGRSEQHVRLDILKSHHQSLSSEEARLDIMTAWSIVLQLYTGNTSISFGLSSGSGLSRLCQASVDRDISVKTIRRRLEEDMSKSENFQVPELVGDAMIMGAGGDPFCNTAVLFDTASPAEDDDIAVGLHLHEHSHSTEAKLVFSRTFLGDDDAADIVNMFQQILGEVAAKPTALNSELQLIHPLSSRKLFEWNSMVPFCVDLCVGKVFEEQAHNTSTNMAIHASDESFTYAELERASRKLAIALQAKSVGPEDVVLLCFPKSAWAVVAMMAVVRAGATMLFFDVSHPIARLQEIQNQVQAKIMLTVPQYVDLWDWSGTEVIPVNSALVDSLEDYSLLTSTVKPNNSLYIIYTSG